MILAFDELELDTERLELRRDGELLRADALVLRMLAVLLQNAGRLVTKDELVEQVWQGRAVADNVITVCMARLRKTLGERRGERERVVTVYGRGYRFERTVAARNAPSWIPPAPEPARAASPPFVGRERVLLRLRHALDEACAGRGRVCVLLGEAGIGKTRAVEALERELPEHAARVAWGYCRETGETPPLAPWLRVLRTVIDASGSDPASTLGPLANEVTRVLGAHGGAPPSLADGEDDAGAGPVERHRVLDAIVRTLAKAAERTPWLLVLDDLHRADAASLELLAALVDEIADTRLLVVATMRHAQGRRSPRGDTHLPYVLGHRSCERIGLERLPEAEVARYVAALVDDPDGALARAVFHKSEGNPFFMAELCRPLQEGEPPSPEALRVPGTALELIGQRLDRLDENARALLEAAAVIGRSFELPLLSAITGGDPGALMADLDDALAAEIVVAAPGSMTAFAFGHELLRAALYEAMPPARQRQWHLRIARALEQRLESGERVAPSELAYHMHCALPEGDLRKTVQYCRAAAAAAGAAFANADVVRYARHALEALDLMDKPSVRLRMRLLHTIALYARGHATADYVSAVTEVVRLAREHGDGPMLVQAAAMMNVNPGFKPLPGASSALEHALQILEPSEIAVRSIALAMLAVAAPQCRDRARSEALLSEALELARKSGQAMAIHTALAAVLYLKGGPEHAAEIAAAHDELERIAREQPRLLPVLPASLALHRSLSALQRGDAPAVSAALESAAARLRELGGGQLLWHVQRRRALCRVNAGAWTEGVAELQALHRQAEQSSILGTEPFCAFDRVVVLAEHSGPPPLDDALRSALEPDASEPPSLWAMKTRALAAAGLADEARAALRALTPAELARLPSDAHYLGTLGHLSRAALQLKARDYVEALLPLLSPHTEYFAGQVSFLCEGAVPQLLGMLCAELGRRPEAIAHLERAIGMNERAGFLPRVTEARAQLAALRARA